MRTPFRILAPGRVCLFGEHSDYLGLGAIPAAISLRITIDARPVEGNEIRIIYEDPNEVDHFPIDAMAAYRHQRDYVRSAFNMMRRRGGYPEQAWEIVVSGDIPLAAGLSSSSALTVAAVFSFARIAGIDLSTSDLAVTSFNAEVTEFHESGGMMDHLASAYGGVIHLDDHGLTQLPARLGGLVIGDSLEPKTDTVGDLVQIRTQAEEGYSVLGARINGFDHRSTPLDRVEKVAHLIPDPCRLTTITTLRNRDLTRRAYSLLLDPVPDKEQIGQMIDQHHHLLRDGLGRSTPKIERLISAAKEAGALGCKINGSGGGGTMLAYAPGHERPVMEAIESAGGVPYMVEVDNGARIVLI
ncbi:MAG: mevalonate kinase family protein [Candidatus Thorarchaeota archaeon]